MNETNIISITDAARVLDISSEYLRVLSVQGRVPCVKTRLGRVYDAAVIAALAEERRAKPPQRGGYRHGKRRTE